MSEIVFGIGVGLVFGIVTLVCDKYTRLGMVEYHNHKYSNMVWNNKINWEYSIR